MLERAWRASHPDNYKSAKRDPRRELSNNFGFTEIAIERTACFGRCPVYVASITKDGSLSYRGESDTPRVGQHSGTIYGSGFNYLAGLADELGIYGLEDSYSVPVTDNPTVYVALTRNGKKKIIHHYAPRLSGPLRLNLFEQEIDRAIEAAEWASSSPAPDPP